MGNTSSQLQKAEAPDLKSEANSSIPGSRGRGYAGELLSSLPWDGGHGVNGTREERSPSLPPMTIEVGDGEVDAAEWEAKLERRKRRAAKRERKELRKEKRERLRSLGFLHGNGNGNGKVNGDNTQTWDDPSSQLLKEFTTHFDENATVEVQADEDGEDPNAQLTLESEQTFDPSSQLLAEAAEQTRRTSHDENPEPTGNANKTRLDDWMKQQRGTRTGKTGKTAPKKSKKQMKLAVTQAPQDTDMPDVGGIVEATAVDSLPTPPLSTDMPGKRKGKKQKQNEEERPSRKRKRVDRIELEQPGISDVYVFPNADLEAEAVTDSVPSPGSNFQPVNSADIAPSTKKSKKRKSANWGDENHSLPASSAKRRKTSSSTPLLKHISIAHITNDSTSDELLPDSGQLVAAEWSRLDRAIEEIRHAYALEQHEVNAMVQNTSREKNEQRDELWNILCAVLPQRTRAAVQKACKRRYHNYSVRAKWTEDDDGELQSAYARNPQKWVEIGKTLGRMPEDCRDRWRNYHAGGATTRQAGLPWSQKEETDLSFAVQECAELVRQDAKQHAEADNVYFNDEQDWTLQVNFSVVSDKMHQTRSRLQCYQHWRVMQKREETQKAKTVQAKWRKNNALKKYAHMTPRDKMEILDAIAESNTIEEERIPWRRIVRMVPVLREKFTDLAGMDLALAFKKMKRLVEPQVTLEEKLDELRKYYQLYHGHQLDEVEDAKEGEMGNEGASDVGDGVDDEEPTSAQRSKDVSGSRRSASSHPTPTHYKSTEWVDDSSDSSDSGEDVEFARYKAQLEAEAEQEQPESIEEEIQPAKPKRGKSKKATAKKRSAVRAFVDDVAREEHEPAITDADEVEEPEEEEEETVSATPPKRQKKIKRKNRFEALAEQEPSHEVEVNNENLFHEATPKASANSIHNNDHNDNQEAGVELELTQVNHAAASAVLMPQTPQRGGKFTKRVNGRFSKGKGRSQGNNDVKAKGEAKGKKTKVDGAVISEESVVVEGEGDSVGMSLSPADSIELERV